jgi:hypothetical protein
MSFGTTPLSTTVLSVNQFPVSAVYIPNTSGGNFTALAGGPASSADTNGNISAPVSMYLYDGNDVTAGGINDAAVTGDVTGTISAKLRGLSKIFAQLQFDGSNFLKVNVSAGTVSASQSGTWNVNNISGTISLPTGAATDATVAKLTIAQSTALGSNTGPLIQGSVTTGSPTYTTGNINPLSLTTAGALRVDGSSTVQPVSGTFWQATQPISAASLPLPSGAATSAKQPALGTAGSASTDVLTVQGIASMTALKVDGSATTQPVSGTVTANAGTGNFTVVQTTGSNLHAVLDSGSTTAVTQATASNLNAQVVGSVASAGSNAGNPVKIGGAYNSTQPTVTTGQIVDAQATSRGALIVATGVDAFAVNASQSGTWNINNVSGTISLPTGAATSAKQPALGTAGSASSDVLTVQGITSMTPLKVDGSGVTQPISGTITANAGTGTFNNQQSNITADYDTGAGTQTMTMFGVALPASGGAVSGGTSSNPLRVDPIGTTTQPISGTVTANIGTSGSLALDTSVNGILLSQGSTTSGQKGPLTLGAVTTSAPSYTTAQTSPLSLDTSGLLRVSLKDTPANTTNLNVALAASSATVTVSASGNFNNASIGSTGSAVPASASYLGANKSGNLTGLSLDTSGNLNVNVAAGSSGNAAASATGSAVPVDADYIGINVAGNLRGQTGVNPSGSIYAGQVDVASVAGSSVATAATGIMKVGLTDGSGTAITSTSNAIDVNIKSGGGSGFSVTDEAAWTAGTSAFVPTGGVFNDSATALTSGQEGSIRLTNNRAIHVNLRDASANQLLGSKTSANSIPVVIASDQGAVPASQSGTWNITNVSGTVSLPTGAATSAKQPALGTAGSASSDVITVQGIASMTALRVDGSAVTQPVSGTVTANAGSGTFNIQSNASVNVNQIAGSSVSTAATGVQKVGIVGNGGASVDSTVGAGTAPTNAIVTGSIYNSSAPAPTNGQAMALQADQAGNIRTFPGIALTTLSAWNSGTSLNATQTIFTNSGTPAVLVQLTQTTTLTAGAVTFEVSYDGSTWLTIPANDVVDPTSATFAQISLPYTLQASTNKQFLLLMNGAQGLRAKLSTQISGSGTVTPNYALLASSPLEQVVAFSPTASNFQVTANAGTNLNTSLLALESGGNLATLAGGVTSSKYQVNVAQINGVAPTMGNGVSGTGVQRVTIASDSTGQVTLASGANTIGALTANQTVNIAQVAGGNTSNAGQTGAMQVGGAVATNNNVSSATNPLLIAGSDYGGTPKVQSLKVDSSGNAQVAITNTPTVTANIGTSGSLALDATVAKLNVAQAAALGSNTGPMIQGSVTTNAPSYSTGNINPLSLDTAGLLRISIKDTPANTNNLNVALAASSATVTVTAANLQTNLNQIAGSAISTAASGVQKVGIVGNAGASVDSAIGAGTAPTNAVVTGAVYNSSAPAPTNGQAMALQVDQAGNIRTFPGIALTTLSAWNSGTSLNATQNIFTNSGAASVLVQLTQTTTLTAGAVTFEVSYDNSNWSTIPASCVLDPTSTTFAQISLPYTVQASTNKQFLLNMNGAQGLRVKLSTQISGSGSVTPNYALLPLSPADTVIALSPTAANFNVSAVQSGTWNVNNVSGTVSLPTGAATSAKQPALGTAGSASSDVLTVQGIASMTALKVDGSAVTQPVSGTITANIGTSGSLALDTSVNGILLSQGSTTSGQKGSLIQGAVTTNAPSYTTAQTSPLSLDTSGLLRASLKDTPSNTNNLNVNLAASAATVTVSGTVTANQGGSNWSTNVAQIGGTNIVTGGASGLIAVGGPVASGSSNADNPVKVGGAYNSTQPTVTTGQIVDAQYTARGAAIVATGTDTFTVTANAGTNLNTSLLALESGGNLATLAGGITSSKYQANVAQINGVAPSMGNGVSGTGVQRVTIASDSTGQVTLASGANTIGAVTQASGPWTSNVTQIAGSSISTAATGVQKVGVVGNAGATVDSTVGAGTAPTNAIVTGAIYNTSAPAPTNGQAMALQADQAGNTRTFPGIALAALSAWNSSTGLNATQNIFTNSGAEAVLVQLTQTTTLTAGAITFEVTYDNSNWSTIPASAVLDPTSATFAQISVPYTVQASTNKQFLLNMNGAQGLRIKLSTQITGTGSVTPNYALLPASPADTVIALSPTAANFNTSSVIQATAGTALTADQSNTILKTSLYVKKSANADTVLALGSATSANSVPVVVASDQGAIPASQSGTWTAVPNAATSGGSTPYHSVSGASTNATNVKNAAGQLYGYAISNTNAAARYVKLYDKSSSPTIGTDTPKHTVQIPGNGTVIRAFPVGLVFSNGIGFGTTTGVTDADTGAVSANDLVVDLDYH